jgi:hypothetical protein
LYGTAGFSLKSLFFLPGCTFSKLSRLGRFRQYCVGQIDPGFGVAQPATQTIPFLLARIPEKNGVVLESPEILLQW